MADKETGLNIPVSAVADKNSAKEAVNELTKNVLSSLKDGYIEIPAEIKVPIKGASKDLEKAQKDVINQWEKTFKEGFSSSAKDLDALTDAYQRFKKLAGQQHKTATKQSRGISAIMGEPLQNYSLTKKQNQAMRIEMKKQLDKAQKRNAKQRSTSEEKQLLKDEIDNAIKQENKRKGYDRLTKDLNKGAGRAKASTPGSPTNLGFRTPSMNSPYMNEKTLRMSEISPYRNVNELRLTKEQQEIKMRERASLKSRKATDSDYNAIGEKIKQREIAKRPQSGTEYDLIKKALLTEVARLQGALVHGKSDTTSQDLINQVLANLTYDEQNNVDPLKSVMGIHNMLQKRYDAKGKIGTTDGSIKGEGVNQEQTNETLTQIYKILGSYIETRQSIADNVREIRTALTSRTTPTDSSTYSQELNKILNSDQMKALKEAIKPLLNQTEIMQIQNIRESSREGMADDAESRANKTTQPAILDTAQTLTEDSTTGFNTDKKANDLISTITDIFKLLQDSIGGININDEKQTATDTNKALSPYIQTERGLEKTQVVDRTSEVRSLTPRVLPLRDEQAKYDAANYKRIASDVELERETIDRGEHSTQQARRAVDQSEIEITRKGILGFIEDVFKGLRPQTEVERLMAANEEEQARIYAERRKTYGETNGRNMSDTGDIAGVRRIKELFGWQHKSDKTNKELLQNIKLTPGFTGENAIDPTKIMEQVSKVLTGPEMFKAQTGGWIKNLIGPMTMYLGQDSLEKSRSQAEGLNQVMANVRNEILTTAQSIRSKEMALSGMQKMGDAKFNEQGEFVEGSSIARKTFTDMEELKETLRGALAEVATIDQVVSKTGGKVSKILKNIGFAMPELRDQNVIIHNINSGLDKNGKALKFQSRTAEILNYSFQLMARHIGQMIKNWMMMLNPLNLIKRAFQDFSSYDPKWQRTLNVIKYNLRDIIRPFMEWIAQQLVNMIGFLDLISMKIQEAFGNSPISLFDQQNAQAVKEEYEDMMDISAGFDELHDVGSSASENNADNLLGSIYRPELSQEWQDLANEIGDLFAGLIKGDLGFGEVMARILEIAWDGITTLWNEILWPFIKNTIWPAIKDNVLEILGWILGAFVAWKGLKLIGKLILNAISGVFTKTAGTSLLKNLFTDANGVVGIGRNLGTLLAGGILAVVGAMALADAINNSWNQGASDAVTGKDMDLNDKQTNMDALKGALGGASIVLGGGAAAAALGATVALGPLVAVAAGVAALAAVVVVGAEAWAYHSKQNQIANNEMLTATDYAEQAATAEEELIEIKDLVANATNIQSTNQEKLNKLEQEYGMSLEYVNQKVQAAGGSTELLTTKELALYEQGKITQESVDNYNRLLEIQIELQKKSLWAKEQEAIALNMEAGEYELAALRIEQAELQGLITTDEATAKRIQLYKACGDSERRYLLQNLTDEQRTLLVQYTNTTDKELGELADIYWESSEETREALLAGVDEETRREYERRMNEIDKIVKEHQSVWQGIGDTLTEIVTGGKATTWTYNGKVKYYEEEKRKTAKMAVGTNYVPNDGFAYLHQGEAVIPAKYNNPYRPNEMSAEEQLYMRQMMETMRSLDSTMKQGIPVNGQFVQRGSDLVAVVNKTKSQTGADLLSNVAYAR